MKRENSRKIKLLRLWEILRQETDENHPMSTNEIIARLKKEGIDVDRKILYTDIDLLNENGYEVLCEREKSNKYYVIDRSFDIPEVRILMDAVQAAGFITEKKTKVLIDKIAELAGSRRAEVLKENITEFSTVKSENENIYYSIDTIVSAREENKQIGFYYFDYNIKKEKVFRKDKKAPEVNKWYVVNPVETVYENDQYYLICYDDKHKTLANYRIDRMDRVSVLDTPINKYDEIEKIDLSKYKRQQVDMYSG
ncbi:MAG: WYL domain-containing protein, partial [Clostridia bacterium]|nr:WYL domain-containing protein [Clostridia bacterium]